MFKITINKITILLLIAAVLFSNNTIALLGVLLISIITFIKYEISFTYTYDSFKKKATKKNYIYIIPLGLFLGIILKAIPNKFMIPNYDFKTLLLIAFISSLLLFGIVFKSIYMKTDFDIIPTIITSILFILIFKNLLFVFVGVLGVFIYKSYRSIILNIIFILLVIYGSTLAFSFINTMIITVLFVLLLIKVLKK